MSFPIQSELNNLFIAAAELIFNADHVLITAGAGMGVDSGLPDFRGVSGFYRAYPAFKLTGKSFADIANPVTLFEEPKTFWWFYGHRFELYTRVKPHLGYNIVKNWVERKSGFVYTSNVDGHFAKIGVAPNRIVECHGSIRYLQCAIDCDNHLKLIENLPFRVEENAFNFNGALPRCLSCGGYARPNILMFDDFYWNETRVRRQAAEFLRWIEEIEARRKSLVVVEIGAGKAIPRIREKSESMNVPIIRINPNIDDAKVKFGISVPVGALEALKNINKHLIKMRLGKFTNK
ncbi:hypothetical protein HR45_12750 [Shewanella mangrovi]|uniref:protein acetyllysine N-acetyltransferase n=1 Tax=Shewanella mangrovi TaxID=1515746 RepID=A0A094LPL4_9GAMM|nr:Sir2 family NAD-dependent protein deacetylase [Shewanella mangrovi]KFZ37098.1 hypothetical protein HR45_12750 [Shewanella mangrovi]